MPDESRRAADQIPRASRSFSSRFRVRVLLVLAALFSIAFLIVGDRLLLTHVAAIELDTALRAALVSRYEQGSITPLTLVAIDDATAAPPTPEAATWGFSDVTPRDKLAQMLGVIASAKPALIVVDIDFSDRSSDAADSAASTSEALGRFLRAYAGPPLILVKRADTTADGQTTLIASRVVDPIVAANSNLSWAHGTYATDRDGTVRKWYEWLVFCGASEVSLPSVPLRVLSAWPAAASVHLPRPQALTLSEPCHPGLGASRSHIIIYDEALSGRPDAAIARNLSRVSAWQVLDPKIKRDDQALFFGRAVLVGGTRTGSADLWRTPVGMLPGIELMANTVRFAPGQLRESGHATFYSLVLFLVFCALRLLLRPIVAIAAATAMCTTALLIAGPYAVLDAIENAILLFVELSLVEECIHLWLDARTYGWRFVVSPHLRGQE
jgi:CHASE2 domain-containing sensor protein